MKICILSDSHDNRDKLHAVVEKAVDKGAEAILHCGDVVSPSTFRSVVWSGLPIHVIHGNNTGDLVVLAKMATQHGEQISYYGRDADITLADRRIFMVHYPHYAEAMALTGRYDLVCCGHSHHARIDKVSNIKNTTTILANPGNTAGIGEEPKYIMADLANMQFDLYRLDDD
jgi:uncharacterized protein